MKDQSVFIIKPNGMPYFKEIRAYLQKFGFNIQREIKRYLEPEEIAFLYKDIFHELIGEHGPVRGSEMAQNHIEHLLSGPSAILLVENSAEPDFFSKVLELRGKGKSAETCAPNSIRSHFPGNGVFNSCHASVSTVEMERDRALLFDREVPFLDHELFKISDKQFADSVGYNHQEEILALLTYKKHKSGPKVIGTGRYFKRFFDRDSQCVFAQQVTRAFPEIRAVEHIDEQLVQLPYQLVCDRYWSWSGFRYAAERNRKIGSILRKTQEVCGPHIILGLSGSTLAGQVEYLPDIDVVVYGRLSLKTVMERLAVACTDNNLESPWPSMRDYYALEKKARERIRFSPNYGIQLAMTAVRRKSKYKCRIEGVLTSFWCRYWPCETPSVEILCINDVRAPFRCIIEDNTHDHFMPVMYRCGDGNWLLSYNRFLKGALKPGDVLVGTASSIEFTLNGIPARAHLVRHDDQLALETP